MGWYEDLEGDPHSKRQPAGRRRANVQPLQRHARPRVGLRLRSGDRSRQGTDQAEHGYPSIEIRGDLIGEAGQRRAVPVFVHPILGGCHGEERTNEQTHAGETSVF